MTDIEAIESCKRIIAGRELPSKKIAMLRKTLAGKIEKTTLVSSDKSAYNRAYYQRRVNQKKCVDCGGGNDRWPKRRCSTCKSEGRN